MASEDLKQKIEEDKAALAADIAALEAPPEPEAAPSPAIPVPAVAEASASPAEPAATATSENPVVTATLASVKASLSTMPADHMVAADANRAAAYALLASGQMTEAGVFILAANQHTTAARAAQGATRV